LEWKVVKEETSKTNSLIKTKKKLIPMAKTLGKKRPMLGVGKERPGLVVDISP